MTFLAAIMEIQAPPAPIEIKQSPFRMFLRTIRSALLTALIVCLCILVILIPVRTPKDGVFALLYLFIIIGLGIKTLALTWRFLTVSGPVITLNTQGMRDTRISTDFIPWNAITWKLEAPYSWGGPARKPTILTMVIDETIDKQLKKTPRFDVEEIFNRFKGYEFTSHGLEIKSEELIEHIYAFSKAADVAEERYKCLSSQERP